MIVTKMKKSLLIFLLATLYINVEAQNNYQIKRTIIIQKDTTTIDRDLIEVKKVKFVNIAYFNSTYWKVSYNGFTGFTSKYYFPDKDADLNWFKEDYYVLHPRPKALKKKEQRSLRIVQLGMSSSDLEEILGEPTTINKSTGSWGINEQWVYSSKYSKTSYYYFTNGKLTSWDE